jgi:hypothetical protein
MAVYYAHLQALADTLASIGQPLRPDEFDNYVLDGLDEEYDSIVELARERGMPSHDLYSRLLSTEQRIESRRASVHHAHAARYGKQYRPTSFGSSSTPPPGPSAPKPNYSPRSGSAGGNAAASSGRVDARTGGRSDSRVDGRSDGRRMGTICQLCDEPGHVAARCFKRFNKSFLGMYNDGRFLDRQLSMANHVYGPSGQAPGHTSTLPVDPAWYLDSGATDHFSAEMDNRTSYI